jgi:hypothetical protein
MWQFSMKELPDVSVFMSPQPIEAGEPPMWPMS